MQQIDIQKYYTFNKTSQIRVTLIFMTSVLTLYYIFASNSYRTSLQPPPIFSTYYQTTPLKVLYMCIYIIHFICVHITIRYTIYIITISSQRLPSYDTTHTYIRIFIYACEGCCSFFITGTIFFAFKSGFFFYYFQKCFIGCTPILFFHGKNFRQVKRNVASSSPRPPSIF